MQAIRKAPPGHGLARQRFSKRPVPPQIFPDAAAPVPTSPCSRPSRPCPPPSRPAAPCRNPRIPAESMQASGGRRAGSRMHRAQGRSGPTGGGRDQSPDGRRPGPAEPAGHPNLLPPPPRGARSRRGEIPRRDAFRRVFDSEPACGAGPGLKPRALAAAVQGRNAGTGPFSGGWRRDSGALRLSDGPAVPAPGRLLRPCWHASIAGCLAHAQRRADSDGARTGASNEDRVSSERRRRAGPLRSESAGGPRTESPLGASPAHAAAAAPELHCPPRPSLNLKLWSRTPAGAAALA